MNIQCSNISPGTKNLEIYWDRVAAPEGITFDRDGSTAYNFHCDNWGLGSNWNSFQDWNDNNPGEQHCVNCFDDENSNLEPRYVRASWDRYAWDPLDLHLQENSEFVDLGTDPETFWARFGQDISLASEYG